MPPRPTSLDAHGIEQLYVRLEGPLYNVVYRWLWESEEAHDVVQEAFVRLWRMRERIKPGTVEALTYRIALNLAANRRRRRRLWRWVTLEAVREPATPGAGACGELEAGQRREALRRAIDELPERHKRVIVLCELSELSYAQVAEALSIAVGTVGSRRNTALRLLRARLAEQGIEESGHE